MKRINQLVKASYLYTLTEMTLPYYKLGDYYPPHNQKLKIDEKQLVWPINAWPLSTARRLIMSLKFLARLSAGLSVMLLLLTLIFQPVFYFDSSYPYLALFSGVLYYIADFSYYRFNLYQWIAVTFHRDTGMIELPTSKQGKLQLRFNAVTANLSNQLYGIKEAQTYLLLQALDSKMVYPIYKHKSELKLVLLWSFINRYMESDKPLPDVPALEPYRESDPVTRHYDQIIQRKPDYWRGKTQAQVLDLVESIQINLS